MGDAQQPARIGVGVVYIVLAAIDALPEPAVR